FFLAGSGGAVGGGVSPVCLFDDFDQRPPARAVVFLSAPFGGRDVAGPLGGGLVAQGRLGEPLGEVRVGEDGLARAATGAHARPCGPVFGRRSVIARGERTEGADAASELADAPQDGRIVH